MSAIDHLLVAARAYGQAEGLDLTTVSWRLFQDSKKLGALVDGADIQTRRLERAMAWLSGNWPEGAEWPPAVPRPAISSGAAA